MHSQQALPLEKLGLEREICYNIRVKVRNINNSYIFTFFILIIVLLSGCSNHKGVMSNYKDVRVEKPSFNTISEQNIIKQNIKEVSNHKSNKLPKIDIKDKNNDNEYEVILANNDRKKTKRKNCNIMDRFDRKMLLAFEKDNGNIRYGFDIDGISYKSVKIENIMFTYRKKLNPSKTRKTSCRFNSGFQGLVGSAYNEIFLRKDDTIWKDLKDIKREIRQNLNLLMQ